MAPRAIIIGAPGAGKTSVGRRVADRLGVPFHDSDAAIQKRAGKRVSDIFLSDGEAEFRRLEREVIAESLRDADGVLSVGGGAVLDPETREAFSRHTVVWLEGTSPPPRRE